MFTHTATLLLQKVIGAVSFFWEDGCADFFSMSVLCSSWNSGIVQIDGLFPFVVVSAIVTPERYIQAADVNQSPPWFVPFHCYIPLLISQPDEQQLHEGLRHRHISTTSVTESIF